jgi:Right handed beta helix region
MKTRYTLLVASILFGLAVLRAGASMADPSPAPMGDPAKKPALKKHNPVTCNSTEDIVLDKVIIESSGPAVTIMAACDVTIKNSVIRTTESAIRAMASGDVTIIDSTVESKATGLLIGGSGDVTVRGSQITGEVAARLDGSGNLVAKDSRFRGKKVIRGTGEYEDGGGNTWE